jgi:hypothetical protein
MTTSTERAQALRETRTFLRGLADPEQMPGVPLDVRREAQRLLRNLPGPDDVLSVLEALARVERA